VQSEQSFFSLRTIGQALADLREKYARDPEPDVARMIQQLEAEIAIRKLAPSRET
jgi:hypothetical protein